MERLTSVSRPVLVEIGREQLAAVPLERLPSPTRVVLGDRLAGELLETDRVDGDVGAGEEPHHVVTEHDGVVAPGRTAGGMGGLVQARGRTLWGLVGPEQVHHLFAMEPGGG